MIEPTSLEEKWLHPKTKQKIRPGQTEQEMYKIWRLQYEIRPKEGSNEYRGVAHNTKSSKTPSIKVTGQNPDDVLQKLKNTIDSSSGSVSIGDLGVVTIFFNVELAREIIGHSDEIFADVINHKGKPVLVLSPENLGGMHLAIDRTALSQRKDDRIGQQAFNMPAKKAQQSGLTLARYSVGEPIPYMDGVSAYALEFRTEVHPGEIVRLSEPGVTVSPPVKGMQFSQKAETSALSESNNELTDICKLAGIKKYGNSLGSGSNISITGMEKAKLMKEHNIKPGTPEWFQLWFSRPFLTSEPPIGKK